MMICDKSEEDWWWVTSPESWAIFISCQFSGQLSALFKWQSAKEVRSKIVHILPEILWYKCWKKNSFQFCSIYRSCCGGSEIPALCCKVVAEMVVLRLTPNISNIPIYWHTNIVGWQTCWTEVVIFEYHLSSRVHSWAPCPGFPLAANCNNGRHDQSKSLPIVQFSIIHRCCHSFSPSPEST